MLATFADMQLPFGARFQSGMPNTFLPTVNLTLDYVAGARMGAWIEGETEVLRKTRSLIFAQCRITADGALVVRANGLFKIGPEINFPGELDKLLGAD
jgi:acyl-coenzyme A thioesterase PaaI-like protein